jgi:hypothetical protein
LKSTVIGGIDVVKWNQKWTLSILQDGLKTLSIVKTFIPTYVHCKLNVIIYLHKACYFSTVVLEF